VKNGIKIRKRINPNRGRRREIISVLWKFFLATIIIVVSWVVILWLFVNDKTNVEANKFWANGLKDFEANIEFQRAHPNAEPLGD